MKPATGLSIFRRKDDGGNSGLLNDERRFVNGLGDREASIILGNRPQTQHNQGKMENPM